MREKGIVASAVRAAVSAAEKAIAPSPLAKRVVAAAAAEAIRHVEERAPEILAPVEKALRKNAGDLAKPIDEALSKQQPKRGSQKSAREGGARRRASSRKAAKPSHGGGSAVGKRARRRKKAKKSKRR
jgi:hypothetical protein